MPRPSKAKGLSAEQIKAKIRDKGITLVNVADDHNVGHSTVRRALRLYMPGGCAAIAATLKMPPHKIWPEWFDENDTPFPDAYY
ncbi:MAG: helix-turn-helix domain-containing protein, partial [Alphaproteobacteria bacterium]